MGLDRENTIHRIELRDRSFHLSVNVIVGLTEESVHNLAPLKDAVAMVELGLLKRVKKVSVSPIVRLSALSDLPYASFL